MEVGPQTSMIEGGPIRLFAVLATLPWDMLKSGRRAFRVLLRRRPIKN